MIGVFWGFLKDHLSFPLHHHLLEFSFFRVYCCQQRARDLVGSVGGLVVEEAVEGLWSGSTVSWRRVSNFRTLSTSRLYKKYRIINIFVICESLLIMIFFVLSVFYIPNITVVIWFFCCHTFS